MEQKPKTQKKGAYFLVNFFWILLFLTAVLFFLSSVNKTNYYLAKFDSLLRLVFEIALILLAIMMVFISLKDVRRRRIEQKKKNVLLKTLKKQRALLQKKFTVESSALNFALSSEEEGERQDFPKAEDNLKVEEKKMSEKIIEEKIFSEEEISKKVVGQIDRPKTGSLIVEEESFSDFSPEWQTFLRENEKKSTIEKLNKMLEIN